MRIATVQFAPQLGEVAENIRRADEFLRQAREDGGLKDLDILVLPELAFSGYNHPSLSAIRPYLEPTASGPSTIWAKQTARSLNCIVAVGYPERAVAAAPGSPADGNASIVPSSPLSPNDNQTTNATQDSTLEHTEIQYNALVFVSAAGDVVAHYRKTFLYYTDETWASENPDGFFAGNVNLPNLISSTSVVQDSSLPANIGSDGRTIKFAAGICMDINPHKFTAPWTAYEFANHCLQAQAKLVVLSMAWLTRLSDVEIVDRGDQPDLDTLGYWIERFSPLLAPRSIQNSGENEEVIVIFANRSGAEGTAPLIGDVRYAGSSCVMGITPSSSLDDDGQVRIWDILGKADEGVLEVDTNDDARFHLKTKKRTGQESC